jgi:t-SNARE complex subunit (syntaxin)
MTAAPASAPLQLRLRILPVLQGAQLDEIQHNVQGAAVLVVEGKKQLAEAKVLQGKRRRRLCLVAGIALVVLVIIAVVVAIQVRAANAKRG